MRRMRRLLKLPINSKMLHKYKMFLNIERIWAQEWKEIKMMGRERFYRKLPRSNKAT
jgi:hypothetical protein